MSMLVEGVSDAYRGETSGSLISTFSYYCTGSFPELYKYTYPEQILVDMLYPESNMAMRPVHIGQASTDIINKAFVTGAYFWIYDLVDDNSFHRDPKQLHYLKDVIALRNYWLQHFGHGVFRDTDGILEIPETLVKRFDVPHGVLLAVARAECSSTECAILSHNRITEAAAYTVTKGIVEKYPLDYKHTDGKWTFPLPQKPISLIVFNERKQ